MHPGWLRRDWFPVSLALLRCIKFLETPQEQQDQHKAPTGKLQSWAAASDCWGIALGSILAGTITHPMGLKEEPLNEHVSNVTFWGFAVKSKCKAAVGASGTAVSSKTFPQFVLFIRGD